MTLDEAIALLEKMAKENEEKASLLGGSENVSRIYWEYAARSRVVACWLMELKMYRGMIHNDEVTE